MRLAVRIAPDKERTLELKSPVIVASGTVGYGTEYAGMVDIDRLGAIVCKGTTLKPRAGNPQPRICETASGILNSVGLENIGIEALIKDKTPVWAGWNVPVIVNIAGESAEEYAELAWRLDEVVGVGGIEVNISCPNVARGGMEFGTDPRDAAEITKAVRGHTALPVIVKLSPNVTDIAEIARAVEAEGADAVSLVNTLRGMSIDIAAKRPFLGGGTGGLSGPAIKPVALYMVYRVRQAVSIPVIGGGGIVRAEDAIEFIMAGASAIWVSTGMMVYPAAPLEVLDGIIAYMQREGVEDIAQLVGVANSP
ncbi:MAG: dihydroorotate dehydrogenase [Chloroflexota bacterium]|nr:dihydroorotate dehydrogenase [Chloroflexota bacterium]